MHWFIGLALIGSALLLAGGVWLAASVTTLLRSLEDAEESTNSYGASERTRERMQVSWARSAFVEMAEWKADT